jgi:hypothetical protein
MEVCVTFSADCWMSVPDDFFEKHKGMEEVEKYFFNKLKTKRYDPQIQVITDNDGNYLFDA